MIFWKNGLIRGGEWGIEKTLIETIRSIAQVKLPTYGARLPGKEKIFCHGAPCPRLPAGFAECSPGRVTGFSGGDGLAF
jgi:hypothetical protein